MATRDLYKRFMALCQKWPRDDTKPGRDYADLIRSQLMEHFPQGELGQVRNTKQVEAQLSSLERLANNNYFNENLLKRSSSSGLEAFACKDAVSNEGIELICEENENTLFNRLRGVLSMKFVQSDQQLQIDGEKKEIDNKPKKKDST